MKLYHYIFYILKISIYFSLIFIKFNNYTNHKYDKIFNKFIPIPNKHLEIMLEDILKILIAITLFYLFTPDIINNMLNLKPRNITKYDRGIAFTSSILLLSTINGFNSYKNKLFDMLHTFLNF